MALKYKDQYKTVVGNTVLTLTPRSGESILVRDILINTPVSAAIVVKVSQTTIGFFRGSGNLGNHLPFPIQDVVQPTIIGLLQAKEIFRPIPVAEGETLMITGVAQASSTQAVRYDIYDAGDVLATQPNGSKNSDLDFISYGTTSGTPANGINTLNTLVNSAEFIGFPWSIRVPENRQVTIFGVLFSDVAKESGTGANKQASEFLSFTKNGEFLFDLDLQGLPYLGVLPGSDTTVVGNGKSIGGNYSDVDRREPFLFSEPLVFRPGDELKVKLETNVSLGVANLAVTDIEVGLIVRVTTQA